MRQILLVGGAGYIGAVVAQHFLALGVKVKVIDNLIYKNSNGVVPLFGLPGFSFFNGDIRDGEFIKAAVSDVTDVVLLAGLVGDPITKKYPEVSKDINLDGVKNVIDTCDEAGVKRLVFISTCSNYGLMPEGEIATEKSALNPLSLYAEHKVATERYIIENSKDARFVPTIMRFATAFGWSTRMRLDLTVNEFAYEACSGRPFDVYDADTWRPYCHVNDFARAIDLVLSSQENIVRGEIFNVGSEQNNFTKRGLVELIGSKVTNMEFSFNTQGSDPRNYKVDFSKITSELGFEASQTVEDGIDQVIEAFNQGLLANVLENRENYGNYKI